MVWSWGRRGVASEGGRKALSSWRLWASFHGDPFLYADIPEILRASSSAKLWRLLTSVGTPCLGGW